MKSRLSWLKELTYRPSSPLPFPPKEQVNLIATSDKRPTIPLSVFIGHDIRDALKMIRASSRTKVDAFV